MESEKQITEYNINTKINRINKIKNTDGVEVDRAGRIPVTVVMRSYNDASLLPRTLAALDAQEGVEVVLGVMESGSSDGSERIFRDHGFAWMEVLKPGEYWSSTVLNRGAEKAKTEVVVFLNSDAVMLHPRVIRQLAEAVFGNPKVAGAFGAQVVRAGAGTMTKIEYSRAFGDRSRLGESGRWMSLVCSAVRRSVWERYPFDERITYAEDAVWSHGVIGAGHEIAFVPEATAEHSHEYGWTERFRRAYGDASALAVGLGLRPRGWVRGILIPWVKKSLRFSWDAIRMGRPWMVPNSVIYAWPLVSGAWCGTRDGWHHVSDPQTAGEKFDPRKRVRSM